VCPNEPDQHNAVFVADLGNESVLVAADVKDHPAVLEDTGAAILRLDFPRRRPRCPLRLGEPGFQSILGIGKFLPNLRRVFLATILILLYKFPYIMSIKKFPIWELYLLDKSPPGPAL
jgi:hypothetical protein